MPYNKSVVAPMPGKQYDEKVLDWQTRQLRMRLTLPPSHLKRITDIETLAEYERFFNPVMPNNYVFMLAPKRHNPQVYLENIGRCTSPMNRSNVEIKHYADLFTAGLPGADRLFLEPLLAEWQQVIDKRTNFLGFSRASAFVRGAAERGYDLTTDIRATAPGILKRFVDIPMAVKGVLRINLCLPYPAVLPFLQQLFENVFSQEPVFKLIERVEIAKPPFEDGILVNYPTLILYLGEVADSPASKPQLNRLLALLQSQLKQTEWEHPIDPAFADRWFPCASITQGFKLYKNYLELLGILAQEYDPSRNHAYLQSVLLADGRRAVGPGKRNFPWIMDDYRITAQHKPQDQG